MAQNQESVWGTINTALEIAINVFYLIGDKGAGLKVPASYADNPKLQQFLEMGDRDGDYLYFPESTKGYEELKDTVCEEYAPAPAPEPETEEAAPNPVPSEPEDNAPEPEDECEQEDELDGFEP